MIWGMMVDPATGRRFINEGLTRNALAQAVVEFTQRLFVINDERFLVSVLQSLQKNCLCKRIGSA